MAKALKELRTGSNISTGELCTDLNISEETLNSIESGKDLSINYLAFLTKKGVDINQLFGL